MMTRSLVNDDVSMMTSGAGGPRTRWVMKM